MTCFFYGYQCCMKKHGITDEIPNIPSDKEDEIELDNGVRQGDGSRTEDESVATDRED